MGRNVQPETGVTTHPQVIAAAIDAFREAGAEVAVHPLVRVAVTSVGARRRDRVIRALIQVGRRVRGAERDAADGDHVDNREPEYEKRDHGRPRHLVRATMATLVAPTA